MAMPIRLHAVPGIAMVILCGCMGSFASAEEVDPQSLIPLLGAEEFSIREKASNELVLIGRNDPEAVQQLCLRQIRNSDDPEIVSRCRKIILELLTEDQGFIGIRHMALGGFGEQVPAKPSVMVSEVVPGLPAAIAGLRAFDTIVAINDKPLARIDPAADLRQRIAAAGSGKQLVLEVMRGEERLLIRVTTAKKSLENQGIDPDKLFNDWMLAQEKAAEAAP
jgi:membrane-associated protease RseP (regulator of RpoE activity)